MAFDQNIQVYLLWYFSFLPKICFLSRNFGTMKCWKADQGL